MRKIFLLGIVFLLLSATANAQIRGGLKVGGNLTSANFDPDIPFGELSLGFSFNFGGMVDFEITKNFGIEVDLLYNSQKANWDYSAFDPYYGILIDGDATYSFQSLSIPVLAKFRFPSKQVTPFLGVGPEIGFALSSEVEVIISGDGLVVETTTDLGDTTESINLGLTLAGGVDINLDKVAIIPELRYNLALTDLDKDPIASAKYSKIIFLVGVKF